MSKFDKSNFYHHIGFYVSNALQSAYWYCCNFGFERFAFRRTQEFSEIAIRNGKVYFLNTNLYIFQIILLFKTFLLPLSTKFGEELMIHGDFIKDVAFLVDNLDQILEAVFARELEIITPAHEEQDEYGSLRIAKIHGSEGDITHTLIEKKDYNEGHTSGTIESASEWYDNIFKMKRFWSIDDQLVHTQYSALKAVIVGEESRKIQMTLVEPVQLTNLDNKKERKGQVQEFLDFHGGPGIQHIAFRVDSIVCVVKELQERGVDFLDIPDSYYDLLHDRIFKTSFNEETCKKVDLEKQLHKVFKSVK